MICFCKCGAGLTLSHLFNCNRYISYRSTLHDAVRDQIHAMCNSYHIESFVEPLLRSLDINESVRDSEYGKRRADVVVPSGCLQEKCLEKCSIRSIPLDDSELYKRKKYANPLKELKHVRHVDYQICPFAISLYGRLGKTALNFIDDFENLVKKRMNKRFDCRLWLNRIVFTIFKSIPKMISKALMSVSAHYENIAAVRFDDCGFENKLKLNLMFSRNAFGNFLKDIRDSSAAALVTQVPSVYGLLLKDNEWLLNMRFRCFLWPNNLPNHLTCKCGKPLLFTHLLNCKHFITFRSKVHNNVRDQIYVMCKSYRVDSFLEPLLSKLILDDPNIDSTRYNRASMGLTRGDLVVPGLNGSFTILDAMSIDPCNSSNEHFINSDVNNPLLAGEKYKIAKYAKPISSVNENSHAQYNLCPFVFSLLGSLGKAAMAFLEDFVVVVKERTGRIFNRVYWQNRIVFSIFKGMVTLISDSLSSVGKFSESLAINCFDVGEAGFEDVEF
ncbi:hypothetical protein P9112_003765 [Eukaryota sp. TZLM1-RC]